MFTFVLFMLALTYFGISDSFKAIKKYKNKRLIAKNNKMMNRYTGYLVKEPYCELMPSVFLKMKDNKQIPKFQGCYIFHNLTKNIYYVGQSINVVQRVANHIQGRGNADVYFDLRSGDDFRVSIININDTDYLTLNSLEKYLIHSYNANIHGYNKTAGNRG